MKGITVRGLAAAALVAAMTMGCASGSTMNWLFGDWNYPLGGAHAANATRQIANPDAIDAEAQGVEGMDGRNAEDVVVKYHREQQETGAQAEPSIINIGTGGR
jgi:type IV pilus biogenesis protein CpaD/CtpE